MKCLNTILGVYKYGNGARSVSGSQYDPYLSILSTVDPWSRGAVVGTNTSPHLAIINTYHITLHIVPHSH